MEVRPSEVSARFTGTLYAKIKPERVFLNLKPELPLQNLKTEI